jgi:glucokinase
MPVNTIHNPYILCADIGGSHITTAVCDIKTNSIIEQSQLRVEINSHGSADDILTAWSNAFKQVLDNSKLSVSGLAIAMPGPFDYENGISYIKGLHKYEALYGINIKLHFADALQLNPLLIKFRNDAEATIAGECIAGAGSGAGKVMGITLGTGFGSAHSRDNFISDLNLGSLPFQDTIADDYLSTRWFVKRYHELSGQSVENVKELALLVDSDKYAGKVFDEFAINLGGFLDKHVHRLTPDVLIICGNIARASELFLPALKDQLPNTKIALAQLGEHAALIGAAALFESMKKSVANLNQEKNI